MQSYAAFATYDAIAGNSLIDLPAELQSVGFVLLINGQVLTTDAYLRRDNQIIVDGDVSHDSLAFLIATANIDIIDSLSLRVAALESCCNAEPLSPTQLPDLRLNPLRNAELPVESETLGFADLQLYRAAWSVWDMAYDGNDLLTDSTLRTAIILSCWTDAAANDYEGWWGDAYMEKQVSESLLWTLIGKPADDEHTALGIGYVKKALQWLLDDGWITELAVTGEAQQDPESRQWLFAFRVDYTSKNGARSTLYL